MGITVCLQHNFCETATKVTIYLSTRLHKGNRGPEPSFYINSDLKVERCKMTIFYKNYIYPANHAPIFLMFKITEI